MPSPVDPTYLSGKNGSVQMTITVSGAPVVKTLPITNWSAVENVTTWDATNATGFGYEDIEAATTKCTFTADAVWKRANGAPPFKKGKIYPFALNTQQTGASTFEGFSGNALVTDVTTKSDVKGGTMYSFAGQFKGVYDSPDYPTAIADSIATPPVGDFTPPTG